MAGPSRQYYLISPNTGQQPLSSDEYSPIDWNLCALCQTKTKESLTCPARGKRDCSGYQYVAQNIRKFKELDSLPFCPHPDLLSNASPLEETFLNNSASWHKSCREKLSNRSLEKAKRKAQETNDPASPVKTRKVEDKGEKQYESCFFCGESASTNRLHKVSTLELDFKVRKCATILQDKSLLTKLAQGDMIATDSLYHNNCLQSLYYRAEKSQQPEHEDKDETLRSLAFAELVTFIEESQKDSSTAPVFQMKTLCKLYQSRLESLGVQGGVHSTRLRQKLLAACPMLQECDTGRGKDIKLVFKRDLQQAINRAVDYDSEALLLAQVAKILRREIFCRQQPSTECMNETAQKESVPPVLQALISMILDGPGRNLNQTEENKEERLTEVSPTQAASTISQLIVFNCKKYGRHNQDSQTKGQRHNRERETPVPVYISMKLHAETRKRTLVDSFYDLGLSISYDRLMSITTDIANTVCSQFERDGVVVPPGLAKNTFTVGMVDNVDHNPTSTTASESFHGTSISLAQTLTESDQTLDLPVMDKNVKGKKTVLPLPPAYTMVTPVDLKKDLTVPPVCGPCKIDVFSEEANSLSGQEGWLKTVQTAVECSGCSDGQKALSWGAYNAAVQQEEKRNPSNIALLPLLVDNAHSPALIKHVMQLVKACIQHLNAGQIPVLAMDQPLYAIGKEIQWCWPEELGEGSFVLMLGGLHIEMAMLKILGEWLQGSGWTSILESAGVVRGGVADSMLKASHVTRTRLAHQITAAALYTLCQRAFEKREDKTETFEAWSEKQQQQQPMFAYWIRVLELELSVLHFIHSIRTASFDQFLESLSKLVPWFFALDHTNYARWLSVYLRDMSQLQRRHPSVYQAFCKGAFVVKKTSRPFSAIALDHSHEQCNAVVKGDGGAVGLTSNPAALRRWITAGPQIAQLLKTFEHGLSETRTDCMEHHEQSPAQQTTFMKHVGALVVSFEEAGNPFEDDSGCLFALDSKDVVDANAVSTVSTVINIGQQQYDSFVEERLIQRSKPVKAPLPKNKIRVFQQQRTNKKPSLTLLRNDCSLFSRLFIACQTRKGDLPEFFKHENQPTPPSLSKDSQLRTGRKADLLKCLEQRVSGCEAVCEEEGNLVYEDVLITEDTEPPEDLADVLLEADFVACSQFEEDIQEVKDNLANISNEIQHDGAPKADAKILDGAFVVHLLSSSTARTFQEYSNFIFLPYILGQLQSVQRLDVVWDVYLPDSLKAGTRQKRGQGQRRRVLPLAPLPSNWKSFLRNDENKADLFSFLGKEIEGTQVPGKILISTWNDRVVSSPTDVDVSKIQGSTQEEADTRIFLHAADCVRQGYTKILIRAADTDVLVLAVSIVSQIGADELWVAFGTGKQFRYIASHTLASTLGPEKSKALPIFHALTGCDTVSFFAGKGKLKAWDTWNRFPSVTHAFLQLASDSANLTEEGFDLIQRFVVLLYEKNSTLTKVNAARQKLFSQGCRTLENIPPTEDALRQHTLRAAYQGGLVWGQCLQTAPALPSPAAWGWCKDEGQPWRPLWTTLPQAEESCYELIRCGCKQGCKTRCKCVSAGLQCTALCSCGGDCNEEQD